MAAVGRCLCLVVSLGAPEVIRAQELPFDRLFSGPALSGTAPVAVAWSPDSRRVAFLWNDRAQPQRELWIAAPDSAAPRRLGTGFPASAFRWSDAQHLVALREGDLWRIAVADGAVTRLTSDGGSKSDVDLSPDGRWISFLRDGDLWLVAAAGGQPTRVTRVGVPAAGTIPLGTYFRHDVEIGTATWGGDAPPYTWSPDARHIAVHLVDRRQVRLVGIPWYLGDSTILNRLRRSYPGDINEQRRVGMLDVVSRQLRWFALPDESNIRLVNMAWSSRGQLLIDRETDDAIERTVFTASATGDPQLVWRDRRETRIYNAIASAWDADGSRLLLTGDLDDRYRLYEVTPGDTVPRPITPSEHDVDGAAHPVQGARVTLYVANAPDPSERHVFRRTPGGVARLTTRPGAYLPFPSPDGRSLALLFSDDVTPPELYFTSAERATEMRRVTQSPPADFARVPWVRPRYVTFPSRSGGTLRARIIEPPSLDRSRKHPVLFGPVYSNTVRNRWGGSNGMLQQHLAIARGYIVVQVDVRGSTGYGRAFREAFLMDWGGHDLDDLEDAVGYLRTLGYADTDRLGIWGSSYGGTLGVYMLLRKPGLFKAAVAGAPATDPRYFGSDDVAIARRPQSHPDTFRRGAAQYAANLRDHLLIIHGMQDDVVPFQTTVQLAEELMRQGKDFDVAFAPAATHGWTQRPYYARHLLRKLVDHFDRYLR